MSRLFLMVFVAGMLVAFVPPASADVPNCDCLDNWDLTWPVAADNCLFVCPGEFGVDKNHDPGSLLDNKICLFSDDGCGVPLAGFDAMRIYLGGIYPDSICVCDEACVDFPYIYPSAPTDANGCTTFRFRGSILQMENELGDDVAWLQVTGCQDRPVRFRSPDVDANCVVELTDFVIWKAASGICPPEPTGYQHYTVYVAHCAPCFRPQLADFVVFSPHFGHSCTVGICDP